MIDMQYTAWRRDYSHSSLQRVASAALTASWSVTDWSVATCSCAVCIAVCIAHHQGTQSPSQFLPLGFPIGMRRLIAVHGIHGFSPSVPFTVFQFANRGLFRIFKMARYFSVVCTQPTMGENPGFPMTFSLTSVLISDDPWVSANHNARFISTWYLHGISQFKPCQHSVQRNVSRKFVKVSQIV